MLDQKQMALAIFTIIVAAPISIGCQGVGSKSDIAYPVNHPFTGPSQATVFTGPAEPGASGTDRNPDISQFPESHLTKQQYCPVTGAKLGSMGSPVPAAVGGQTVYVCCAGCVEELTQNPEKYLRANQPSSFAGSNNLQFQDQRMPVTSASSLSAQASRACSGSSCCH